MDILPNTNTAQSVLKENYGPRSVTFSLPKRLFTTIHQEFLLDISEFSPHQSEHTKKWEGVGKPVDPW